MKIQNLFFSCFFIGVSVFAAKAQDIIYILYQPECFKIYHYDLEGDIGQESSLENHTDYHLVENNGADIVFRVLEANKVRYERYLPEQGVVDCAQLVSWDNDLFKQLNQRQMYAYMVERMPNNTYKLMRVDEAINMILKDNYFYYEGKDINFKYYFDRIYASGEDIRLFPEGAGAAFPLGTMMEKGMTQHAIRYYAPSSFKHSKHMDLYLHPEYGLLGERINSTRNVLSSITDMEHTTPKYATNKVEPPQIYNYEQTPPPTTNTNNNEGEEFFSEETIFKKPNSISPNNRSLKTHPISNNFPNQQPKITKAVGYETIYHTIITGDNLYRLAQRYKTTEEEIKQLNGLKSNDIFLGQRLKIK